MGFDIEERPESYAVRPPDGGGRDALTPYPEPEEGRIYVYPFEGPVDAYFQVDLLSSTSGSATSSSWGDRALAAPLAQCCSWCMAELAGVVKVPFVIIFVVLGQVVL